MMKLVTTYSILGLQLLNYLAHLSPQQRVNIQEIAHYYRVSYYHLTKVVGQLNRLGYLHTWRGPRGGILLKQSPETIQLGDVIQALERGHSWQHPDHPQHAVEFCHNLFHLLKIGLEAFFIQLNEFTLIDLVMMSE